MIFIACIISFRIHKNIETKQNEIDKHNKETQQLDNLVQIKMSEKKLKAQYGCDLTAIGNQNDCRKDNWPGFQPLADSGNNYAYCQNGKTVLQGNGLCGIFSASLDKYPDGLFKIENSDFQCTLNIFYATGVMSKIVQLIHFLGSGTHTITETEFRWCGRNAYKYNEQNNVPDKDRGKIFPDGWDPSLIVCDGNSQNIITNAYFTHPSSGSVQGWEIDTVRIFRFRENTNLYVINTRFYNASARNGGSFLLLESLGSIIFEGCDFNFCKDNADKGHAIQVNTGNGIRIRQCVFTNCGTGTGSVIHMDASGLVLEDCKITFTNIDDSCRCVFCQPSGVYTFKRNTFSNAKVSYNNDNPHKWRSTVIHIESGNQNNEILEITDNIFDNIAGNNQGRCIYAIVTTNKFARVTNNTIKNCPSGLFYFKIIFRVKIDSFTIDSCKYIKNTVSGKHGGGAGLWIQQEVNGAFPPYVLNIENCEFIDNHAENKGGGFQIGVNGDSGNNGDGRFQTQIEIRMKDCTFSGNTAVEAGGAIAIQTNQPLTIEKCHFIKNSVQGNSETSVGGAIYIQTSVTYFSDTVIMPEATIINCEFQLNYAYNALIIYFSDATETDIKFEDCDFVINYQASIANGFPSIVSYINKLSFDSCQFRTSSSDWQSYSIIDLLNSQSSFKMDNCSFDLRVNNNGKIQSDTQILYSKTQDVFINDCKFNYFNSYAIMLMNDATNADGFIFTNNDITGNKKFLSANNINRKPIISGNNFYNLIVNDQYLIDFTHTVDEILFQNNTFKVCRGNAELGGSIGVIFPHKNDELYTLIFDHCKFIDTDILEKNGGAFAYDNILKNIKIEIKFCYFYRNFCYSGKGGAIYLSINSDVLISDCTFDDITAGQNGGAIYIDQAISESASIMQRIHNCSFHNCKSNTYVIEITKGNVEIDNCFISFDANVLSTGAITVNPKDCIITNCNFTRTNALGSIAISQENGVSNPITVTNCIFDDCSGPNRRCFNIDINGNTELTFRNNMICNMKATDHNGYFGLINYKSTKKTETFIENMAFLDNKCNSLYGGGSGLWISNTDKITFINCKFINNAALRYQTARPTPIGTDEKYYYNGDGGGIQYGYTSSICDMHMEFRNCTFKNNKAFNHGGAIALQTTKTVIIVNCIFEENIANYRPSSGLLLFNNYYDKKSSGKGGAIYLNPAFSYIGFNTDKYMTKVNIEGCKFISNSAHDGYAIYIEGDDPGTEFTILHNEFINNYNLDTLKAESSIISTEICRINLPYKEIIQNNHFVNEIEGKPLAVREIVCVDHSGNPLLTPEFTKSKFFSYSSLFSKSNKFSLSDEFSKTDQFTKSQQFKPSSVFSKSSDFSSSKKFSKSKEFSTSSDFTKSTFFSQSNDFTSSKLFSSSDFFSESKEFSTSTKFTKTMIFSQSNDFTLSNLFSSSDFFSESKEFSASTKFTKTMIFSQSSDFSLSKSFSKSIFFSESIEFTTSSDFTKSTFFSQSNDFTSSKLFANTDFFSESKEFSTSLVFTKSKFFSQTKDFTLTISFSKSVFFSQSIDFTKSTSFKQSNIFSSSIEFSKSGFFSKSNVFMLSSEFTKSICFSQSNGFEPSLIFPNSNFFSESTKFSASFIFSNSFSFSKSNDFSSLNEFSKSESFSKSSFFSQSNGFKKTDSFSNSEKFSPSIVFTKTFDFSSSRQLPDIVNPESTSDDKDESSSDNEKVESSFESEFESSSDFPTSSDDDQPSQYKSESDNSYEEEMSLSQFDSKSESPDEEISSSLFETGYEKSSSDEISSSHFEPEYEASSFQDKDESELSPEKEISSSYDEPKPELSSNVEYSSSSFETEYETSSFQDKQESELSPEKEISSSYTESKPELSSNVEYSHFEPKPESLPEEVYSSPLKPGVVSSSSSSLETVTQKVTPLPPTLTDAATDIPPLKTPNAPNIDNGPEPGSKKGSKSSMGIIIGVVIGVVVLLAIIIIIIILVIRKKKKAQQDNEDRSIDSQSEEIRDNANSMSTANQEFANPLYDEHIKSIDPFDQAFEED